MAIEFFDEAAYVAPEGGINEQMIIDVASFVLRRMDVHPDAVANIFLVDQDVIADLHVRWMDLEGPTDVMSFPMDEITPGTLRPDAALTAPAILGDIVLCPEFAAGQAARAGHGLAHELALLTTHGCLHLLGYDHVLPEEEQHMFALQNQLLADWYEDVAARGLKFQPRPDTPGAFPSAADREKLDYTPGVDQHIPAIGEGRNK